jgi:hypothetical protein
VARSPGAEPPSFTMKCRILVKSSLALVEFCPEPMPRTRLRARREPPQPTWHIATRCHKISPSLSPDVDGSGGGFSATGFCRAMNGWTRARQIYSAAWRSQELVGGSRNLRSSHLSRTDGRGRDNIITYFSLII